MILPTSEYITVAKNRQWVEKLELVKAYCRTRKDNDQQWPISGKTMKDHFQLGRWVQRQRVLYHNIPTIPTHKLMMKKEKVDPILRKRVEMLK